MASNGKTPRVFPEGDYDPDKYDASEWDDIRIGLGEEWDFERYGILMGTYLGAVPQQITDRVTGEIKETAAYQFQDGHGDTWFIWETAQLREAFSNDLVRVGDMLRITFLGEASFTTKSGEPRRVKRYKVQARKS